MNNELKYNHIKRLWYLEGGVIYTRWGNRPVAFANKGKGGHHFAKVRINGKSYNIWIHEAVFMLFHDRSIAEGKEIHHKDGNHENNAPENLIELTPTQHKRIHKYQNDDPMRAITLCGRAWRFQWYDDNGRKLLRRFNGINEAMEFRAEIEEPRRRELRALGLNCKKEYRGVTASQLRKISRKQNSRLFRTHI
ncbi:HNH endonuclease [Escherichia coli]|nr:HNH endonuclease [Escherichia coli]MBZ8430988.1 HNH endonuclease [Escherichia coli]MCQ6211173.1 HNH endonuclease [Escherichia coli]MCQ6215888.1 HNH endonuclease [Escherichia coli]